MTEPVDSYTRSVALIVGLVAAALLARLAIQPFFAEAAPTATFIVATGAATILDASKNLWANRGLIDSFGCVAEGRIHGRSIPGAL